MLSFELKERLVWLIFMRLAGRNERLHIVHGYGEQ